MIGLHETIKAKLEGNITIDVDDSQLVEIINHFNNGSDDDFLINLDVIEYENLGVNDFEEIGVFENGETAYLSHYPFLKFCELVDSYGGLNELYEEEVI